ncbi:MAG TPA: ATP-binding protein [Candidatus Acidoferrales bacterium]|nr:ATP-binding protein [Candidatus Acidoferrales bacterium]
MPDRPSRARRAPPWEPLVRAFMDDARNGVLLLDSSGRLAAANAAAGRLLGFAPARERGRPAAPLLRTAVAGDDLAREVFRRSRLQREALLQAPGGEVQALVRSYRLGRPPWVLVTLEDLAQVRRMQQELRRNERLATLGQLAAGVAHEIRNPLAGIGTSAQVLLRRFEPRDDRARFVQVILSEVARLDRIVTSLLQYARPRVPELRSGTLAECVDRVIGLAADAIQQAGVRVEVEVAPRLAPLYIDPDLVTQVLLNVTLNAVQAMPEGGTLRYEVRKARRRRPPRGPGRRTGDRRNGRPAGSEWIEYQQVAVVDTGVGIPRGVLEKMFDPFFTTKASGTGLGLSISQTILQEHGGWIAVDSREGRGTTVLLNFPLEKRHGERRQPDARPERRDAAHRR